jgi:MFS transporter, DHA2 family, lincomycin resistance protein
MTAPPRTSALSGSPTDAGTPAPGTAPLPVRSTGLVLGTLVVSAMVMLLNETVLSVALPALMDEFGVPATSVQWLTTGFLLTMAVVIPTTGFLIARFSTRQLYLAALGIFLVGTMLATVAPVFSVLLLARVLQACGTALIFPLLMTTTLALVPPERRGTVMGLNAVVISVAPALGPTLSGLVIDALSWRWVFGLMVPLLVVVIIVGGLLIRPVSQIRRLPLDLLSVVLATVAFGGLVYGLGSVNEILAGHLMPLAVGVLGALTLVVFCLRQVRLQKSDRALLDLRPLRIRDYRLALILLALTMGVMLGTVIVLPIYLQDGRGVSVSTSGLMMLPGGLLQGLLSPVIGRVYDRFGPRPVVVPGAVLLLGAQIGFVGVETDTSLVLLVGLHIALSLGIAMLMTPLMTVALSALPPRLHGHGTAILSTLQQLAGAAGIAVLVTVLSIGVGASAAGGAEAVTAGSSDAFLAAAVGAVAMVVLSFFVRTAPIQRSVR